MKKTGRLKSSNIEDRRTPKKIRNNNTIVITWNADKTKSGGTTEKGIAKMRDTEYLKLYKSERKKTKYKKKKLLNSPRMQTDKKGLKN